MATAWPPRIFGAEELGLKNLGLKDLRLKNFKVSVLKNLGWSAALKHS
jgi:hypothetical protein